MSNSNKKWKLGQCVTINGKKYRISSSRSRSNSKACHLCMLYGDAPCTAKHTFSEKECEQKIQDGNYPKLIYKKCKHYAE